MYFRKPVFRNSLRTNVRSISAYIVSRSGRSVPSCRPRLVITEGIPRRGDAGSGQRQWSPVKKPQPRTRHASDQDLITLSSGPAFFQHYESLRSTRVHQSPDA